MACHFVLLVALGSALLVANEQSPARASCVAGSAELSRPQVKALVKKKTPINAPFCAEMLHIRGTVVLAISVDAEGNVTCIQVVSGHPLIIGVAIESVRQWKFQRYTMENKKGFCGRIALRYQASEYGVKYKIL